MHSNIIWALVLTFIPTILFLLISLVLKLTTKKFIRPTLIIAILFLIFPVLFLGGHIFEKGKEMTKRQGKYYVTKFDLLNELCDSSTADSLILTLEKNGDCYFNYKPCFVDKRTGTWTWKDDMVGAYVSFDFNCFGPTYLTFDTSDTLRLKNKDLDVLTFIKQPDN